MAGRTELFARSIARQWSVLVKRNPKDVIVLSPYLTSRTAEAVIQCAELSSCKIYTLFCAEVFAVGASSLPTLKRLVTGGYQLHHVDDLHAKVVLTNSALSVGSQNLTAKGTRNLEVSAIVTDGVEALTLRQNIMDLVKGATPITQDHIAAIEPLVRSLRIDYVKFKKRLAGADLEVASEIQRLAAERQQAARLAAEQKESARLAAEQKESARLADAENERKTYELIRERSASIREVIKRGKRSAWHVRVRRTKISYDNTLSGMGNSSGSYTTLKADKHSTLLRWCFDSVKDEDETLDKTWRYLMINADTGRLAWPALFATQISKTGRTLMLQSSMLAGVSTSLDYELIWDSEEIKTHNVRVIVSCPELGIKMTVTGYFSIDAFAITEIDDKSDTLWRYRLSKYSQSVSRQIISVMDDQQKFVEKLRLKLLEPFIFKENSINNGLSGFLAGANSVFFYIHLRKIKDTSILVLSEKND